MKDCGTLGVHAQKPGPLPRGLERCGDAPRPSKAQAGRGCWPRVSLWAPGGETARFGGLQNFGAGTRALPEQPASSPRAPGVPLPRRTSPGPGSRGARSAGRGVKARPGASAPLAWRAASPPSTCLGSVSNKMQGKDRRIVKSVLERNGPNTKKRREGSLSSSPRLTLPRLLAPPQATTARRSGSPPTRAACHPILRAT